MGHDGGGGGGGWQGRVDDMPWAEELCVKCLGLVQCRMQTTNPENSRGKRKGGGGGGGGSLQHASINCRRRDLAAQCFKVEIMVKQGHHRPSY